MSTTTSVGSEFKPRARHGAVAVVLWFVAVVVAYLAVLPVFFVELSPEASIAASVLLGQTAYVVVALAFLLVTGRGVDYLDIEVPRAWTFIAGVTAVLFGLRMVIVLISWNSGFVPAAPTGLTEGPGYRDLFVVMIPASLFVIGPAEELLFRGTIQKYLRERFSMWQAIVGASVLYTIPHVFTLSHPSTLDIALTLVVLFTFSIGYGWLYERTRNVVASMIAHGVFNAAVALSAIFLTHP